MAKRVSDPQRIVPFSSADIAIHLKGVKFPISKADMMALAKKNGARGELLEAFERMPDRDYHNVVDVSKGIRESNETEAA